MMDQIFLFITENWKLLIALALAVANLFVAIFRKKVKVVDNIPGFILDHLPMFITSAEKMISGGSNKKEFVLSSIDELLRIHFGVGIEDYIDFVDQAIEKILATPQKKGI